MLFRPDLVDLLGDIVRQNSAQVAGMVPVAAAFQDITHVLVDAVDTCDDRHDQTAAGHHDVHVLKRNAFGGHEILDSLVAHVGLIHYGGIFGDILRGMFQFCVEHTDTVGKIAEFRGRRPRVDDKNVPLLRDVC